MENHGNDDCFTPAQELALAVRHLDDTGFCENLTGHVTWQLPGADTLLVNPWGLWWAETNAADILTISMDGEVLEGERTVTTAVHIHTELHRLRPDARVVVHNHPPYGSVLAALGVLPEILHQNFAPFDGEMVLVQEYGGEINSSELGLSLAERIGSASVAVLVSHGVIVTAPTLDEAIYKSVMFERMCEMYYRALLTGLPIVPIDADMLSSLKPLILERCPDVYWAGAVRQLLALEPEILN